MAGALQILDPASAAGLLRGAELDAKACLDAHPKWKAPRDLLQSLRGAR
jgi:hypothetical protein